MSLKVVAIIQARTGSSRLPGKVLKQLKGKTVLEHVIERVRQSIEINEIVIATTIKESDEPIVEEAKRLHVPFYRGSEENVLSRYYYAAKENQADVIVRITSDCPLIDPLVIDEILRFYKKHNFDYVSNAGPESSHRTYPRGLDTEVFSFDQLEKAFNSATKPYEKEHVTPYIYENSNQIYYYKNEIDYSNFRWTLDTNEDLELILKVYDILYKGDHNFYLNDIVKVFNEYPYLVEINKEIEQKKIK